MTALLQVDTLLLCAIRVRSRNRYSFDKQLRQSSWPEDRFDAREAFPFFVRDLGSRGRRWQPRDAWPTSLAAPCGVALAASSARKGGGGKGRRGRGRGDREGVRGERRRSGRERRRRRVTRGRSKKLLDSIKREC